MTAARLRIVRTLLASLLGLAAAMRPAEAHLVCTIVADAVTGIPFVREGRCDTRVTPASTFKVAISLMGFDAGILVDAHAPALPFRDGYAAWRPEWRATTDPAAWMQYSVVWYSQQTTRALGETRFRRYVTAFRYGNEDVTGDRLRHDGLTHAWLSSSLKISPAEQIEFLRRVVRRQLPLAPRAYDLTARILPTAAVGGWTVRGKTGTGAPVAADGTLDEDHAYGWYVGWAVRGQDTVVFARLAQDDRAEATSAGPRARDALLEDLPAMLAGR